MSVPIRFVPISVMFVNTRILTVSDITADHCTVCGIHTVTMQ